MLMKATKFCKQKRQTLFCPADPLPGGTLTDITMCKGTRDVPDKQKAGDLGFRVPKKKLEPIFTLENDQHCETSSLQLRSEMIVWILLQV